MGKVKFSIAEENNLEEIFRIFSDAIVEMNKHNISQWDEVYNVLQTRLYQSRRGKLAKR